MMKVTVFLQHAVQNIYLRQKTALHCVEVFVPVTEQIITPVAQHARVMSPVVLQVNTYIPQPDR